METCGVYPWGFSVFLSRPSSGPPRKILNQAQLDALPAPSTRLLCLALLLCVHWPSRGEDLGLFEKQADIGQTGLAGSAIFDSTNSSYLITGGGENMWGTTDAFHFVWTQVSSNFSLKAGIEWLGTGGNPHRKACLVIRQSL